MKHIKLEDCNFHDAVIQDVDYDGRILTFYIQKTYCCDFEIEIPVRECDLNLYFLRQYPRFHKVTMKGKEISFTFLKSLIKRGYVLEIVDFLKSVDLHTLVFDCLVSPCSSKAGVYKKIVFKLDYEYDYFIFKEYPIKL